MEDKIKEKKITGPGGIGTSRPGTAETTEQVSAGSLSSGCKATACGVDPRPCSQWTTGTNFTANMNSQEKGNKITGAGEIDGPRPGAEGMQRVPPASSSHDRKGEQVACSSTSSTGARNARPATQTGQDTVAIISDSSASSGGASQPHRGTRAKRRKRTRVSTTPPFSGAIQDSETESETS